MASQFQEFQVQLSKVPAQFIDRNGDEGHDAAQQVHGYYGVKVGLNRLCNQYSLAHENSS